MDRLTNDNNSKIKPDNTNKIFAVRSTIFQDSSFVCQAKIICNLLFEQKIIENLLFRANTEIEIADLFFFFFPSKAALDRERGDVDEFITSRGFKGFSDEVRMKGAFATST